MQTTGSAVHDHDIGSSKKRVLHINFPPVKDNEEVLRSQQAAAPEDSIRKDLERDIPPVIRSVLELSHLMVSGHSHYMRASPGYQGGIFYKGSPYCFSGGYRDSSRSRDKDDKGNHMRLKDPLVYGLLSLPITAAYLCELHGKNIFDLERPLIDYLPELHGRLQPEVTARRILSFTTVLDDRMILQSAGARMWAPLFSWNACAAMRRATYEPITRFLSGGNSKALSGRQQRENLIQFLRSSRKFSGFSRRPLRLGRVSHFSLAFLIAAVETQLKGVSFEDSIRAVFFEPAQSHGAGYGPPKLWRDPNEIFYRPSGLAAQHEGFHKPVSIDSLDNCGPPVLNASLNLFSPVEEYAKLLMLSLDTIQEAREILGSPSVSHSYYDLGVKYITRRDTFQLKPGIFSGLDFIPTAASFLYDRETDLGCFGIASCGTRNARLFAHTISQVIRHLFIKHVLREKVTIEKPLDLDNPTGEATTDTERKFKKVVDKQKFANYFSKHDAHTRF